MDRGQFIDIGDFDVDAVDLDSAPQSAEHYLQQVIADRIRGPSCVSVAQDLVSLSTPETDVAATTATVERDPRAPSREWCQAKVAEFSTMRSRMESISRKNALRLQWPHLSDAERWEEVLLRRCHPKCEHFMPHFPHHQGTPPAVPVVLSISSTMVNTLISYAVEWAEDEFTRALREWLFALLLIIEKPLLPDVCAALRALASTCRRLRSRTDMKSTEEIHELSWFIVVVGEYFGQTDLADL
ncbi:hypothetical protein Q1695_015110 [Nippostrongylus brasiliensis]|nr:hypothetical protein Q1695_015110 [Nippostrongylus brasiliensis]